MCCERCQAAVTSSWLIWTLLLLQAGTDGSDFSHREVIVERELLLLLPLHLGSMQQMSVVAGAAGT